MKTPLLLSALLLAAPSFAHDGDHHPPSNHAQKGDHKDAPRSFDKQPAVGTWARCPVSGDIFKVGEETEFATYQGRVYAFCCDECKPDFVKDPAKFADKKAS
jgi:YHS domain-containing protein